MSPISHPRAAAIRVLLLSLGAVQALNGLHALLAPRSFYEDFPFGRGWVEALPAYSEHLVRDVGALFIATAVVLIAAGIYMRRLLAVVALISFLAFSAPHLLFHLFNLEPYGAADLVGNVFTLGLTVLAPAWCLLALSREGGTGAGGRATATSSPTNGRIAGVPEETRSPLIRLAYRSSRRRDGVVMDPLKLFAHAPVLLAGYGAFELATERSTRVPERIKHLASLRAAMICGCEWCLDYGSSISTAAEVDDEDLRALPAYASSDRFDAVERTVLDYATAISRTPVEVSEELFARLAEHFDEAQLVELTSLIALENYRARFNWAFGLAGQGFSAGAFCVRPDPGEVAAAPRGG